MDEKAVSQPLSEEPLFIFVARGINSSSLPLMTRHVLDAGGIAAADCKLGNFGGDNRPEIACAGDGERQGYVPR